MKNLGGEYGLAEVPVLDELVRLGYGYLPPAPGNPRMKVDPSILRPGDNELAREGMNQVILRDELIAAVMRINDVPEEVARAAYHDLIALRDNEKWTERLRGAYSRNVPSRATKKTLELIDFRNPGNNTFTATHQLRVESQSPRRPDVVVYVNGIPLAVIEAKSPLTAKSKSGEAFDQIKQYERDIPRLFYSNLLNLVTDGLHTFYGTTGAVGREWSAWRDPWPRKVGDFANSLAKDLWCLFSPERLLMLLGRFVVFERRDEKVTKKIGRYHQFRAVEKIVQRVRDEKQRQGLIWHTQGSGKSLTMVFAALALKIEPDLGNPSLLVLTDRKQLDRQISGTFLACGLPNPEQMGSSSKLRAGIRTASPGLTLLSTLHKFEGSTEPVAGSDRWVVLVDEAHRSQEADLGAFLRASLPDAFRFGFTGTPVKSHDKNTYANFGVDGEGYLDRYSIDDAVADGATVPIRYTSRKTEWQIDPARLDVLFDQWFAGEPEEWVAEIKRRGVTIADLAKHQQRVRLIAYDIWTHFRGHLAPDGLKAQIVAIDREAVVLHKRALDEEIAVSLEKEGRSPEDARREAGRRSACVYSPNQEDAKPSEDPWIDSIRRDLVRWYLDEDAEKSVLARFEKPDDPLAFLIVCNKLLTGFDAPIEGAMYLDSPLRDHNLLQAIARTNRVYGEEHQKPYGLIVDYIGVTRSLGLALASYRKADVENALRDLAELETDLRRAHGQVMALLEGIDRGTGAIKAEYEALAAKLGSPESWYDYETRARAFIRAYEALAPDPAILPYRDDLKWVATSLPWLRKTIVHEFRLDLPDWSAKIREMLAEHLKVTGLRDLLKLRKITDPDYWHDFQVEGKAPEDLREAAIRKAAELKAITREKAEENPLRYGRFSERVLEIIRRMDQNLEDVGSLLGELERVSKDFVEECGAHEATGLSEREFDLYRILAEFAPPTGEIAEPPTRYGDHIDGLGTLAKVARDLDRLYASDDTAPPGWHRKDQLRKELRQQVRLRAHEARLTDLIAVPARVEEFALRHHVKLAEAERS